MIRATVLAVALGLIVVPISELMFWPVAMWRVPGLLAVYGLAALFCMAWTEPLGVRGWIVIVLAGGIFGWLIEGVIVGEAYEAVPFSLIWTPLAWHMLLSVAVGVAILRMALLAQSVWPSLLTFALLGGFAGLWGAYGWTALEVDLTGQGMGFMSQICLAAMMLVFGHLTLDHLPDGTMPNAIRFALSGLAALVWLIAWGLPSGVVALTVPLLIGVSLWGLARLGGHGPIRWGRVPPRRYLAAFVLPAIAIPIQNWVKDAAFVAEINVLVAMPSVALGAGAWLWAMISALRARRATPPGHASGSRPGD
ncbi:hypothetical protein V8J82_19030 [Gymnodinialimonas sp. 2305UL16-5]|uniref:hypothetical protein n=1 Tax=Gymnodinialimonas mytili TaxID=3126503 RepID=UPI0030A8E7BB